MSNHFCHRTPSVPRLKTSSLATPQLIAPGAVDSLTLPDGVPVAGTLERSNGTTLYRVSANAGDRLLFAGQSASGGGATARLLDPYGNAVWSGLDIRSNSPVISAQFGGDYWLAIDGATNNDPVAPLGYEFTLHRVADTTTSMTLGDKVEDALTGPRERSSAATASPDVANAGPCGLAASRLRFHGFF